LAGADRSPLAICSGLGTAQRLEADAEAWVRAQAATFDGGAVSKVRRKSGRAPRVIRACRAARYGVRFDRSHDGQSVAGGPVPAAPFAALLLINVRAQQPPSEQCQPTGGR
jgi:hypothetical protein